MHESKSITRIYVIAKTKKMTHIKNGLLAIFTVSLFACNQTSSKTENTSFNSAKEKTDINNMLDSFNRAAANANFKDYFNFYTDDAVFAGTDATERWNKKDFMAWAKPIFDKGKAWNFSSLERNIFFDKSGGLAWFDELLNTQMKICRGSGVLVKKDNSWKVDQYILSTTIPNNLLDSVITLKATIEDSLIKSKQ